MPKKNAIEIDYSKDFEIDLKQIREKADKDMLSIALEELFSWEKKTRSGGDFTTCGHVAREIVKLCKQKRVRLIFNLLAENIQYADSLVGKDLVFLMKQNRDLLIERYNRNGVLVVDNLELVCGKDYIDQNWTTEHYKQNGRMIIAQNLAISLKQIYPKKFKNINIYFKPCYNSQTLTDSTYLINKRLLKIERNIRREPEWVKDIKEKAKKRNISLNEMIKLDAKYMYDMENHKQQ